MTNNPTPENLSVVAPIVRVKTMRLSDGRADHFVSIKVGDREVYPHVFREEFKAAYHVALYSWLLNGTDEPELMAFNEGEWPAQTTELVGADPAQIELLQEEVARLQDDLDEARQVLWPEWSTKILKLVRSYSGYDGYDDATEGVDLVAEVEEALSELHSEAEKLRKAAPAEQLVATADANTGEALPGLIAGASSHARGSGSGRPLTPSDQMLGWQDISTAPKTGEEFIARTGPEWSSFSCSWDGEMFVHHDRDDGIIAYGPKQWMPMPGPETALSKLEDQP